MTNFIVEVDGTQASNVVDVAYDKTEGGDVGQADITVMNSQANRDLFTPASGIVIKREDPNNTGTYETDWSGEVIGTPSNTNRRNATLKVEAETRMSHLEYAKVSRPFIQRDSGEIVRRAITNTIEATTSPNYVTTGNDTADWDSNANIFELGNISEKSLNNFGNDFLYADFKEGNSDTWYIRNTSVGTAIVPGRRILKVEMRALINNRGSVFNGEFEIRDHDGINYVWELDIPDYSGFETYELAPEEADFGGGELSTDGAVELRVRNDGGLPEDRALAIDMIRVTPFSTTARESSLSAAEVDDTGRIITRRFDRSILEVAENLATEDGASVFIDDDDVVHYETAGDTAVDKGLNITDDGSTPVVSVSVDRDFDVRNRVTVQGAGDIQITAEDTASIEYYNNEVAKEEPITDKSIQSEAEAESRARGYLSEEAWEDTAMAFTLADEAYRNAQIGQAIDVTWSPEDIDGTYIISEITTTDEGYVKVGLTGNTTA